jgi:hypothetical protein
LEGFAVTDSLPIPRRTRVLAAMLNITSGALSVKDVPFDEAKRRLSADLIGKDVGEEAMSHLRAIPLRILRRAVGCDNAGDRLADNLTISREVIGGAASIEPIAQVLVVLREQRVDHR